MFPSVMKKPAFPTRDAQIDKRSLFLLRGRAVSGCRHKSLQEKQVPTDTTEKVMRKQISKSQTVKIKLCKKNHGI